MNPEYVDIFRQRGHPYHAAMLFQPHARDAEFDGLFARQPLRGGERILDIPAGGGYLARHLGAQAQVTSLEITSGFSDGIPIADPEDLEAWTGHDRAVCLAALHHFDDAPGFLSRLARCVKPGGWLHVADVAAGSPLCAFLDGFVGRYNVTGHSGHYLPRDPARLAALGEVTHCEEARCDWRFPDEARMLRFCSDLFGLLDCPPAALRDALREHVGFDAGPDGVLLHWRLLYVDVRIPHAGA